MLKINDAAPDFTLPNQNGEEISLSSKKGKWVILYFYPKDMTTGCTKQASAFRDELNTFRNLNAEIIGVSKDSVKRHTNFADKYDLNFTLLSDEKDKVCETYGVWQEKSMYGKTYWGIVRTTFIINPDGKIVRIFPKVKVQDHNKELLDALKELQ